MDTDTGVRWFQRPATRLTNTLLPHNVATITWPVTYTSKNGKLKKRYARLRLSRTLCRDHNFTAGTEVVFGLSGPTLVLRRAEAWREEKGYPLRVHKSDQNNFALTVPAELIRTIRDLNYAPASGEANRYRVTSVGKHLTIELTEPI